MTRAVLRTARARLNRRLQRLGSFQNKYPYLTLVHSSNAVVVTNARPKMIKPAFLFLVIRSRIAETKDRVMRNAAPARNAVLCV